MPYTLNQITMESGKAQSDFHTPDSRNCIQCPCKGMKKLIL